MRSDLWWIRQIDHRISIALVFFILLLLLQNERRRSRFSLRAAGYLVISCALSWCIRFFIDSFAVSVVWQGMGYGFHILCMSILYMAGYAFCYEASFGEITYMGMLALTIFKLAWNTFKSFGYATDIAGMPGLWGRYSILGSLVSYAVYLAVCLFACGIYRTQEIKHPFDSDKRTMSGITVLFLGLQILLEFCGHVFTADDQALFLYYFCSLLYTILNYIVLVALALLTRYRRDNEDMQNFINNKMQYYRMSREGITSLQIKCHDLKHQIAAIRSEEGKNRLDEYIARLEDSITEYGTVVECGNETVNIVLTEKNILCSTCNVKFSYILDGKLFDFLSEQEIYSLFGNALDNALESCSKVKDPEKRVISLKAVSRGDMVILHVENRYEEELTMVDGMPVTTKQGTGHGFGLRSIQEIAERYQGAASVQAENHIFKLTVFMKRP